MKYEQIEELALSVGFKTKMMDDGSKYLDPHIFQFAQALINTLLPKTSNGCFEVPRMCELFDLPVEKWQFSKLLRDRSGETIDQNADQIAAAAYAINNHDSMRAANLDLARQLEAVGVERDQLKEQLQNTQWRDEKRDAEVIEHVASEMAIKAREEDRRIEYQSGYLAAVNDVFTAAHQRRQQEQETGQ